MNQVSKSLYRDPFLARMAQDSQKTHLIRLWWQYRQITEVHKSWSKCLKLAGWVDEHGWCMNQVSKSLYRDPFLAYIVRDSQKCTLLHCGSNMAKSRKFTKVGQNLSNSLGGYRSMGCARIRCRNPYISISSAPTAVPIRKNALYYTIVPMYPNQEV